MTTHAQRLDALMDARRLERGLRWKDVAEAAGVTQQTLLQLRKGEPVNELTIAGTERALTWAPGSIARILSGGEPEPAADADDSGPDGGLVTTDYGQGPNERFTWRRSRPGWIYYRLQRPDADTGHEVPEGAPPADVLRALQGSLDSSKAYMARAWPHLATESGKPVRS